MATDDANKDYFTSYSDLHVHELMLKDRPRTVAYRRFFEENRDFVKGKVVMDVGAGTGILSLFAATAGAKKVYAVEASNIALLCQEIVTENSLDSVIEVIHEKVENVKLSEGVQVDIIVSEWMGFYLLHESMLDSVIYARDKFLSPSGILVPWGACLYVAPVDMSEHFEERAEYWSNVYGFDFSPIASSMNVADVSQPLIKSISQSSVLSQEIKILDLDLKTITIDEVKSFCKTVEFSLKEDAHIHGFAFWFDVFFDNGFTLANKSNENNFHSVQTSLNNSGDYKGNEETNLAQAQKLPEESCSPVTPFESDLSKIQVPSPASSIKLATGPSHQPTHWKQTIIFLPHTVMVSEGISLFCTIKMSQDVSNKRHYNITLELADGDEVEDELDNKSESDACSVNGDSDDSTGHPTPCSCGSARCRLISALIDKYDTEHQELEEEAENVETAAEVEAAKEIDAQIEDEGWPMDSSNGDIKG